jgi:hypothetical protein
LTTNAALPGLGSLVAGRASGYSQLALTVAGLVLSMICGGRFFVWYLSNSARLRRPDSDPLESLLEVWLAVRWALLGLAIFAVAWLWSLATSLSNLRAARRAEHEGGKPPRLQPPPLNPEP